MKTDLNVLKVQVKNTIKVDEVRNDSSILNVYWSNVHMIMNDNEGKNYLLKLFVIIKEGIVDGEVIRKIHEIYNHGLFLGADFSYEYRISHFNIESAKKHIGENVDELFSISNEIEENETSSDIPTENDTTEKVTEVIKPKRKRRTKAEMEAIRNSQETKEPDTTSPAIEDKSSPVIEDKQSENKIEEEITQEKVEEKVEEKWEEISFKNIIIDKFLYNDTKNILKVVFLSGKEVILKDVLRDIVEEAKKSENAGNISIFYNNNIRGKYEIIK